MIYTGCYTRMPEGISAQPGKGIEALVWEKDDYYKKAVYENVNPSYLAVDRKNKRLYTVNEKKPGGVSCFCIKEDGELVWQDSVSFPGEGTCHLCISPDGKCLFAADYNSGDLTVIDCSKEALRVVRQIVFDGKGSHPIRQEAPHIHSSSLLSKEELLVADLGTDRIYRYLLRGRELVSNPKQPWITLPAGSGPRHMAFHWNKPIVYVTAELSNRIFLIRFGENGLGIAEEGWQTTHQAGDLILTSHLELWEEKKMLYTAVRGTDEIVWYSVEEETGRLAFRGRCPSGGRFPRHFLLDRRRSCLLAANQLSGNICVFRLNEEGDLLTPPVKCMESAGVSCIQEAGL